MAAHQKKVWASLGLALVFGASLLMVGQASGQAEPSIIIETPYEFRTTYAPPMTLTGWIDPAVDWDYFEVEWLDPFENVSVIETYDLTGPDFTIVMAASLEPGWVPPDDNWVEMKGYVDGAVFATATRGFFAVPLHPSAPTLTIDPLPEPAPIPLVVTGRIESEGGFTGEVSIRVPTNDGSDGEILASERSQNRPDVFNADGTFEFTYDMRLDPNPPDLDTLDIFLTGTNTDTNAHAQPISRRVQIEVPDFLRGEITSHELTEPFERASLPITVEGTITGGFGSIQDPHMNVHVVGTDFSESFDAPINLRPDGSYTFVIDPRLFRGWVWSEDASVELVVFASDEIPERTQPVMLDHIILHTEPVTEYCGGYGVTVDLSKGERPTAGDDIILGTNQPEHINGGNGNDVICGGRGADLIGGGNGFDLIYGQQGNDRIHGGRHTDVVFGGSGDDRIRLGGGDDLGTGEGGHDRVFGGPGDDLLAGEAGSDVLRGGDGVNELYGGTGSDLCRQGTAYDCER